jgi:hypothetical protein
MKIEQLDIDTIIPYARNPRKNDAAVDAVAASIKEFGFKQPVVIDAENVIVAGHTRVKAAKKLGISTIPCVRADDLTEQQVKAYRLVDNKTNDLSPWDFGLLAEELKEIDLSLDAIEASFPQEELDVLLQADFDPMALDVGDDDHENSGKGGTVIKLSQDQSEVFFDVACKVRGLEGEEVPDSQIVVYLCYQYNRR